MRVGVLLPGVAVGVLVLPGCGGDDPVRTVTVTAPGAATPTSPAPDGVPAPTVTSPTRAVRPGTTTVRVPTTVVSTAAAPATTTTAPQAADGTASPGPAVLDPDPVGGTTVARGRTAGTGYSVRVPTGWNDGAKRVEGSSVNFDRLYVKGRGSDVTSSILVVRSRPEDADDREIEDVSGTVRRRLESAAGGAKATPSSSDPVDGEPSIAFVVRRRLGDTAIVQRQVAVVRDGVLYSAGLTAARRTYDDDARTFARFLDSWRWSGRDRER